MANPLDIVAIVLGVLTLALLIISIWAIRRKSLLKTVSQVGSALLLFCLSALLGTLAVATRGYRALTREEVVAIVSTEPTGPQRFSARFELPDGKQASFELAGDELYVDAHILKWKPVANLIGLHTSYELDRVAGRYTKLRDEQSKPRTVYSLAGEKPAKVFELRESYRMFKPLLDTQYGSATFRPLTQPKMFELRVSTTGLLLREVLGANGSDRGLNGQ